MKPGLVFVEIWDRASGVYLRGWWPAATLVSLVTHLQKLILDSQPESDYEI